MRALQLEAPLDQAEVVLEPGVFVGYKLDSFFLLSLQSALEVGDAAGIRNLLQQEGKDLAALHLHVLLPHVLDKVKHERSKLRPTRQIGRVQRASRQNHVQFECVAQAQDVE